MACSLRDPRGTEPRPGSHACQGSWLGAAARPHFHLTPRLLQPPSFHFTNAETEIKREEVTCSQSAEFPWQSCNGTVRGP